MKTKLIFSLLFISAITICWTTLELQSPCDAPLVGGHTGAPGETSCISCHGGSINTGPGIFSFGLGGITQYTPGQTYTGTVKFKQTGVNKFGFVAVALNSTNNTTGVFSLNDTTRTRLFQDNGNRNYVGHSPCGADAVYIDSTEWTFNWQAPPSSQGNITLYIAGLATNHSHSLNGDNTYTSSITLSSVPVSIGEVPVSNKLSIYPNPARKSISISIPAGINGEAVITLLSLNGQMVLKQEHSFNVKGNVVQISLPDNIGNGTYILHLLNGSELISGRVVVKR